MVKPTRNIREEIRAELLDLFQQGRYRTFMNRAWQTKFDVAAHFQNIKEPFLHIAARENHTELIEFLLRRGFEINGRDFEGRTPMHYAMWAKNGTDAGDVLIANGADLNLRCSNGLTAMHMAVFWDNLDHVRYLVQKGARTDILDDEGLTPSQVAEIRARGRSNRMDPIHKYFQDNLEYYMDRYHAFKIDKADTIEQFCKSFEPSKADDFKPYSGLEVILLEGQFERFVTHLKNHEPESVAQIVNKMSEKFLEILFETNQCDVLIDKDIWQNDIDAYNYFLNRLNDEKLKKYLPEYSERLYSLQTILTLEKTQGAEFTPLRRRRPKGPKK